MMITTKRDGATQTGETHPTKQIYLSQASMQRSTIDIILRAPTQAWKDALSEDMGLKVLLLTTATWAPPAK